jgi:hypothetical protein
MAPAGLPIAVGRVAANVVAAAIDTTVRALFLLAREKNDSGTEK